MMMVILWQQYLPSSDLTTTRLTSNPEKKISCLWDDGVRCNVCEKPNDIKCPRLTHGQISFELKGTLPPVRYGSRSSTETSKQREGSIHHVPATRCYTSFFLDPLQIFFRDFTDLSQAPPQRREGSILSLAHRLLSQFPAHTFSFLAAQWVPTTYLPT